MRMVRFRLGVCSLLLTFSAIACCFQQPLNLVKLSPSGKTMWKANLQQDLDTQVWMGKVTIDMKTDTIYLAGGFGVAVYSAAGKLLDAKLNSAVGPTDVLIDGDWIIFMGFNTDGSVYCSRRRLTYFRQDDTETRGGLIIKFKSSESRWGGILADGAGHVYIYAATTVMSGGRSPLSQDSIATQEPNAPKVRYVIAKFNDRFREEWETRMDITNSDLTGMMQQEDAGQPVFTLAAKRLTISYPVDRRHVVMNLNPITGKLLTKSRRTVKKVVAQPATDSHGNSVALR